MWFNLSLRTVSLTTLFQIADINNDDSPDLLISINSNIEGRLVVYEIPEDFR